MFQDAFEKLDSSQADLLLKEVNPKLEGSPFSPSTATIMVHNLSFYPGYRFAEIADHEVNPPVIRNIIQKEEEIIVLDWTNEPIYKLNEKAPIFLDTNSTIEYVRFFFNYIRGRHGRFIIVESVDDISWREEPPPAARKAIGKMLIPLQIYEVNDEGAFFLLVNMMFKDSLFKAKVQVKPNGRVELFDEELIVEDIPVEEDILG
jgi:hypothetical protein